jgi:hypothetical protein
MQLLADMGTDGDVAGSMTTTLTLPRVRVATASAAAAASAGRPKSNAKR